MTPSYEQLSFLGATFLNAVCQDCGPVKYTEGIHKGYGDDVEPITDREFKAVDKKVRYHENKTGHEVVIYMAENRKV